MGVDRDVSTAYCWSSSRDDVDWLCLNISSTVAKYQQIPVDIVPLKSHGQDLRTVRSPPCVPDNNALIRKIQLFVLNFSHSFLDYLHYFALLFN